MGGVTVPEAHASHPGSARERPAAPGKPGVWALKKLQYWTSQGCMSLGALHFVPRARWRIPLASRGARPDHAQSSRCGDSREPLGGLLEASWIRHSIFDRLRSPLPRVHSRTVPQSWARTAHAVRMRHARAASSHRSKDFRQGAGTSRLARRGSNLGLRGR